MQEEIEDLSLCPTCHFPRKPGHNLYDQESKFVDHRELECILNLVSLLNKPIHGKIDIEGVQHPVHFSFYPSEMIDERESWWEFETEGDSTGSLTLKMGDKPE